MRIVTWNCRGGFHRKVGALLEVRPDVAIIQEATPPPKWMSSLPEWRVLWHGADSPIGVAVVVRAGLQLESGAPLTDEIRCFLPAHITGFIVGFIAEFVDSPANAILSCTQPVYPTRVPNPCTQPVYPTRVPNPCTQHVGTPLPENRLKGVHFWRTI